MKKTKETKKKVNNQYYHLVDFLQDNKNKLIMIKNKLNNLNTISIIDF